MGNGKRLPAPRRQDHSGAWSYLLQALCLQGEGELVSFSCLPVAAPHSRPPGQREMMFGKMPKGEVVPGCRRRSFSSACCLAKPQMPFVALLSILGTPRCPEGRTQGCRKMAILLLLARPAAHPGGHVGGGVPGTRGSILTSRRTVSSHKSPALAELVFPPLGAFVARAGLQGQRHPPDFAASFLPDPCLLSPAGGIS